MVNNRGVARSQTQHAASMRCGVCSREFGFKNKKLCKKLLKLHLEQEHGIDKNESSDITFVSFETFKESWNTNNSERKEFG